MVHFLQPFARMDPLIPSRSSLPPQSRVLPFRGSAGETPGNRSFEPERDASEPAPRRTPRGEKTDDREVLASELCVACGLCCQGLLHHFVKVEAGEGPLLRRLGLDIKEHEKHRVFELPCHDLGAEGCRVYSERPATCRSYLCRLLHDVLEGDLDFTTARQRIQRARELDSRLRRELGGADPERTLWLQIAERDKSQLSADGQLDVIELQSMCRRFFHKRDRSARTDGSGRPSSAPSTPSQASGGRP